MNQRRNTGTVVTVKTNHDDRTGQRKQDTRRGILEYQTQSMNRLDDNGNGNGNANANADANTSTSIEYQSKLPFIQSFIHLVTEGENNPKPLKECYGEVRNDSHSPLSTVPCPVSSLLFPFLLSLLAKPKLIFVVSSYALALAFIGTIN